ncbi:MAG: hypothetical protein HN576_13160 [Bacteriovoracaceae bacterium]|jgi:hypothetical protein|nr:hypothetical protein [Bacteriovoracaceae bacterium]
MTNNQSPIQEFEGFFSHDECQQILEQRIKDSIGPNGLGDFLVYRDEADEYWKPIIDNIWSKVFPGLESYLSNLGGLFPLEKIDISHVGFLNDEDGSFTEMHYDWEVAIVAKKLLIKPFVMLIYLTDVEEGGELYFPLQEIKIKPKLGNAAIFPCNYSYPHLSTPVTKGSKHVCRVTFKVEPSTYEVDELEI